MTSGPNNDSQIANHFSLRKVAHLLEDYAPPSTGHFNPAGQWQQTYTMFVLEGPWGRQVGEFSLKRVPKGHKKFDLTVRTRRYGNSGFSQFQRAEIQCRTDTLATPVSWLSDTKMARHLDDKPYLDSGRRRTAAVDNGTLRIHDAWRTRKIPLPGVYSNEWTLLEAVQRLPGNRTSELNYTLIDEYDTPQPAHKLVYRARAQVSVNSGPLELTGYCDLGHAVVPTTYWVDEHHRLVFVCTGLMVYALSATNGQAGNCPRRYRAYGYRAEHATLRRIHHDKTK